MTTNDVLTFVGPIGPIGLTQPPKLNGVPIENCVAIEIDMRPRGITVKLTLEHLHIVIADGGEPLREFRQTTVQLESPSIDSE